MKYIIPFLILLLVTCSMCKKDESLKTSGTFSLTGGTWHLFFITGGIAGIHATPTQNQYKSFSFNADATCVITTGAQVIHGTYSISSGSYPIISFSDSESYTLNNFHDTLVLEQNYSDGFNYYFVK